MRGTGSIYKRGNIWWIDYGYRGERHRESSGSTRKTDATKLLRKRLEEMGRGQLVGPSAEKVTLAEVLKLLVSDYELNGRRSIKRAKLSVRNLRRGLGERTRALDVTTSRLHTYIRSRLRQGVARATVQRELSALKRAFNLAVRAGLLQVTPHIPSLSSNNARTGFFEREDFDALLADLPDYLRPVMHFGYLTGWRVRSEVLPLKWEQVDFEVGVVRLEPGTTKNDEGREFPFSVLPELDTLLRDQRKRTSDLERETGQVVPWVFHRNGKRIRDYRTAWENARERASKEKRGELEVVVRPQLQGALVHDLRRSAVRNLVRSGVPEQVAMKLTGHKTRAVFDRYDIVSGNDLREGVTKLAQFLGNGTKTAQSR